MIEYLIESAICSLIFYLYYYLFCRRARNFMLNRWILITSLLFLLVLPLFNFSAAIPYSSGKIISDTMNDNLSYLAITSDQVFKASKNPHTTLSITDLLSTIYTTITFILLVRFGLNLYSILSGKFVVEKISYKGKSLTLINKDVSPFSFLQTIYVNKDAYNKGEIDKVLLEHEFGHVSQLHSLDVIMIAFIQVFYWFNPFIYLFKKLIRTNHEYLADEHVIKSGSDIIDYSNRLIHYTSGNQPINFTSSFSYPLIKNRLIMLSKYNLKQQLFYHLSTFALICISLFLFTSFSNPEVANTTNDFDMEKGYFYADSLFWSGENQKVYLKGNVELKLGENDVRGKGSFSFLGKVNLLIINGTPAALNSSIKLSGIKCEIATLSGKLAQKKYGTNGQLGAVEINILK